MSSIFLKFDSINDLVEIELESSTNAEFFKRYLLSFNRPADRIYCPQHPVKNIENFLVLANRAKQIFKFDWDLNNLSQENFNLWHKDIETFDLSRYPPWSQEKGDFFIDLHSALHDAESVELKNNNENFVRPIILIKWFEKSLCWPEIPNFVPDSDIRVGDVLTDYPHVGKSPAVCMEQNDDKHLAQSCRLPDACPPGFLIKLFQKDVQISKDEIYKRNNLQKLKLIEWYEKNIDVLSKMFTVDEMLAYNGQYRIGRIKNLDVIPLLQTDNLKAVSIV